MSSIILENVRKEFSEGSQEVTALDGVDLSVDENEFVTVLGPSGCGKTTLLRIIADLIDITSGEIKRPADKDVGYVFQGYALFPWKTVRENLELALKFADVDETGVVDRYLERVGLTEFENSYPHELSGGMQQRVALARALVYDPSVLLMDEPFAALDELTKQSLYEWFSSFLEGTDRTVVYVTHNIEEAFLFSDRLVIFNGKGEVIDRINISSEAPRSTDDLISEEFESIRKRVIEQLEVDIGAT